MFRLLQKGAALLTFLAALTLSCEQASAGTTPEQKVECALRGLTPAQRAEVVAGTIVGNAAQAESDAILDALARAVFVCSEAGFDREPRQKLMTAALNRLQITALASQIRDGGFSEEKILAAIASITPAHRAELAAFSTSEDPMTGLLGALADEGVDLDAFTRAQLDAPARVERFIRLVSYASSYIGYLHPDGS